MLGWSLILLAINHKVHKDGKSCGCLQYTHHKNTMCYILEEFNAHQPHGTPTLSFLTAFKGSCGLHRSVLLSTSSVHVHLCLHVPERQETAITCWLAVFEHLGFSWHTVHVEVTHVLLHSRSLRQKKKLVNWKSSLKSKRQQECVNVWEGLDTEEFGVFLKKGQLAQ